MRTLSIKELSAMQETGHEVIDINGNKIDTAFILLSTEIEELKKKSKEETGVLFTKSLEAMATIVKELQIMNQGIMEELKKHKPKTPKVDIQNKVEMPEIKNESVEWEHEVTEMTQQGRAIKIRSTPKIIKE